jgi:hypothetical protein
MKVHAVEGFFESLITLERNQAWYNRLWRALTREFWLFLKSIWIFRQELWSHPSLKDDLVLKMIRRSIIVTEEVLRGGIEAPETLDLKLAKMQRAIQILDNILEDRYTDMAEAELGPLYLEGLDFAPVEGDSRVFGLVDTRSPEEKAHNSKVYARLDEIEATEWKELMEIFQGQDYSKFNKEIDWSKQYDGSGLKSWW